MKVIEGCAVIAGASSGSLIVAFDIAPSGSVERVAVKDSSVGNAVLEACLERTFKKMSFPAADAGTSSEFPFRLRSGG
jgi:TonB family protein